jgi:hypothetical protein
MIKLEREEEDGEYTTLKKYEDEDDAKEAFKQYVDRYYGDAHFRLVDEESGRIIIKR